MNPGPRHARETVPERNPVVTHVKGVEPAVRGIPKSAIGPTLFVLFVCLFYLATILIPAGGDAMVLVLEGSRFSHEDPSGSEGYDGQFAYQIALNPLDAAPHLDVPAYRYQRILYPLLVRLVAFGLPSLIPWGLILVNLVAIGVGTWATERLLVEFGANRWYALAYGLYGGLMLGLRADLNEPLAQALVQLAILAWEKKAKGWAAMGFALAALAKETALIFLFAYLLFAAGKRAWGAAARLAAGCMPFTLYQLVLWVWLGNPGIGSGGAGATNFSLCPLGGWLTVAQVSWPAFLVISLVIVPMAIFPSLIGTWVSIRQLIAGLWHPLTLSLLLNALVILFLPTSTFREPVAMMRLTLGLMASMLLFGGLVRSRRILVYSQLWILTNVLLLKDTGG